MEENANTQEEINNKEEDNKEQKKKEIFSKLIVSNDNFKELPKRQNITIIFLFRFISS